MLNEEEIYDWWNQKIKNYIKNYGRRNKLTLVQEKEKKFIDMHDKFLETISMK